MIRSFLKTFTVGLFAVSAACAQDDMRPAYGLYGHYALNLHSAQFQSLPETFICGPDYTSGSAGNFAIGGMVEMPVLKRFTIGLRGGYISNKATLRSTETQVLGIDGSAEPTELEKSLHVNISSLTLESIVDYNFYEGFIFKTGLGLSYLIRNEYSQEEQIVTPGKALFIENGKRVRNESNGTISGISPVQAGLLAGVSYELPLNSLKTITASPELIYTFGLTSYVPGLSWKGSSIRAGVAFKYSPVHEVLPLNIPPAEPVRETVPPVLTADVEAVGVTADGIEIPLQTVVVEEFLRKQSQPLLPYIFFDENSADIPPRYSLKTSAEANAFTVEQLQSAKTLESYYEILNVIGRRMRQNGAASIIISGHNSNIGPEKGNRNLSKKRAENIRDYLVNVWNIPASNISLQFSNLPAKPSTTDDPDGIEENRRVEISTSSPEILAPIILNDTLTEIYPPVIRFRPIVHSEAGIKQWNLHITETSGRVLKEIADEERNIGTKDAETKGFIQFLKNEKNEVGYKVKVNDMAGQKAESVVRSFPVELKTIENKRRNNTGRSIESYNLVLFEFNQSSLSPENERITQMIKKNIDSNAIVSITGFTDRFGAEEYNAKLSLQRAQNVAKLLNINGAKVEGLGEGVVLYDNDLPEGRFYSRTINITVESEK